MKKHIVIVGGGYGGLRTLQRLLEYTFVEDIYITLIDRMPYHCLKTEYYTLAAGTEPDAKLRVPFPEDKRLQLIHDEVISIELEENLVQLKHEDSVAYDYLIIGLGSQDKYHGVPGAEEYTYSIQTMEKTRETYHKLSNIPAHGKVTIVGGGLSGVELASELRESREDLVVQIYDRGESILGPFPKRVQNYVHKWFEDNRVDLFLKANITRVEPDLIYNHDQPIPTDVVVWTAGIQAHDLVQKLPVEHDGMGRVKLSEHHYIPEYPNVFVVGDCASLPHAPSAQLAEIQGEQVAKVMQAVINNHKIPTLPEIRLKGMLGSLGKKQGFGIMGETKLTGRVPRLLKSGVLWMYRKHSG